MNGAAGFAAGTSVSIARFTSRLVEEGLVPGRADARLLASHLTGIPFEKIPWQLADSIDIDPKTIAVINRLANGEPLAYVMGVRHFAGLELFVDERVLIPRHETEFLVEDILSRIADVSAPLFIMDVCTGSGAILLALLSRLENARGVGIDISADALDVARMNARRTGLARRARFVRADALGAALPATAASADIFTCNPPYVDAADMAGLEPSVHHEPDIALRAGHGGLAFYKKLLPEAVSVCKTGGLISFELGAFQSASTREILTPLQITPEYVRDIAGIERVVTWKN